MNIPDEYINEVNSLVEKISSTKNFNNERRANLRSEITETVRKCIAVDWHEGQLIHDVLRNELKQEINSRC